MAALHCRVLNVGRFEILEPMAGRDTGRDPRPGRITVAIDGCVCNAEEVISARRGPDSPGPPPASVEKVLEAAYLDGDLSALDELNGPFALVIWDEEERCLVAAGDAIGMKRLHYRLTPDGLRCASRLADLVKSPGFDGEIDRQAFAEYMTFGHVNPPLTIYRGVRILMPGEYLVYRNGDLDVRQYHRPVPDTWRFHDVRGLSDDDLADRLEEHTAAAVNRFLPPERDIAVYLSGGLDTALLCAAYRKHTDRTIHAFTLGTGDRTRDETPYALETAKHLGIENHQTVLLTRDDFLDTLHALPDIYGQPFADSSAIPTHTIARKVGERFPSVVAGEGPDGMYGGVDFRLVYW